MYISENKHILVSDEFVTHLVHSLQSGIANYLWLGIHNTAFLVVFTDPCEQRQYCCLCVTFFKYKKEKV